jgi:hypothetical protein
MFRLVIGLIVFTVITSTARAQSLRLQVAAVEGDNLVLEEVVAITRNVSQQQEVTVNGRTERRNVIVPVMEQVKRKAVHSLKDVAVYDLDGQKVAAEKLADLFKKPRAVVVSATAKFDKVYRDVLKDGTLIVVPPELKLPLPPGPPAGPPK